MKSNQAQRNDRLLREYKRTGSKDVRDQLVLENRGLVGKEVMRLTKTGVCQKTGLDRDDLFNEGILGLMHAIEKFDCGNGATLSTYAVYWIKQYTQRAIHDHGATIRLPVHQYVRLEQVRKARKALEQRGIHEPTTEQLADETGLSIDQVEQVSSLIDANTSLDQELPGDSDAELIDIIADESVQVEDEAIDSADDDAVLVRLEEAITDIGFSDRDQVILHGRMGLVTEKRTLNDLGTELNLSRERVRQIENEGLAKLGKHPAMRALIDAPEDTNFVDDTPVVIDAEQSIIGATMTVTMTVEELMQQVRNEIEDAEAELQKWRDQIAPKEARVEELKSNFAFLAERVGA